VTKRGGVSSIRCLSATRYSNIDIDIKLASDDGIPVWKYRLVFNQDKASRPTIREETVVDLRNGEKTILNRPDSDDENDPLRLTQTALEQVTANKEFRDIADFLKSISYQHIIPQVVRDPKGFSPGPVSDDPFGRDFLLRLWNTQTRVRDSRLRKISMALRVAVPKLQELRVEMDSQGTPHLMGRYEHWRPTGAFQTESQFSDGTLRLFGLLWTMFEGSGPLLLEEPELSLHGEVVRHLPQMFEKIQKARKLRRQLIVSTHSEEILHDQGIGINEIIRLQLTDEGTNIAEADEKDKELMKSGLTAADIFLPKSGPADSEQLSLWSAD
jgi:predicted ATPase